MASATPAAVASPGGPLRGFSRVVLTMDNVYIPSEKLLNTPSMQDGLDAETEYDLRNYGCEIIQTAGVLLKLPQVAMATGQVLFQRYYYSRSFIRHNAEITAVAAVHLASKIEEAPRRIRDCMNVFHHMKQVKTGRVIAPMVLDQNYVTIKNEIIKAERRLLKELGFCVHVKHPHKIIVSILDQLEQKHNQKLAQFAWNYMNDSFRTDVFMRYSPATIASACIYLAARQLQVPLPNNPPWYYVFDANDEQVLEISMNLLKLYARPKVNWEKLENEVAEAKKRLRDAQVKERLAKDMSSGMLSFADEGHSPPIQIPNDASNANGPVSNHATSNGEVQKGPSPRDINKRRTDDGDQKKSRRSRSRSRSPRSRHHGKSSSKHHRRSRSRRRRHSSGGGTSRSSSRSSRSSSDESTSPRHRKQNGGGRSSKKYHENGKKDGDSRRSKDRDRNKRRSRSRSGSRRRDHHHRDRSRDRKARDDHRNDNRRSPAAKTSHRNGDHR